MTKSQKAKLSKKYTPDVLTAIRKDFDADYQAWSQIQSQRRMDLQCISTDKNDGSTAGPWPDAEWQARHAKGTERPCLHEDVLTQFVDTVINQIEANPRGIKATPVNQGADEDSAEFLESRIRQVCYENHEQYAVLNAAKDATQGSYGFYKLETAYRGEFGQKMLIEAIMDPDTCVPGFSKKPDWSDMRRFWEIERMSHEVFRKKYPGAKLVDFTDYYENSTCERWLDRTSIQVCAFWHFEEDERELFLMDGGEGDPDGIPVYADQFKEGEEPDERLIIARRTVKESKVVKTVINGIEALEETYWIDPGDPEDGVEPEIPVMVVTGRVKYELGIKQLDSLVRKGRIGQLLYDYIISAIQEVIALAPKVKWVGYEGQFDTSTNWDKMHRIPTAFAEAKANVEGAPADQVLPLPTFISYEPPVQALELAKQSVMIGIQNAIGMSSTERKDKVAKSGKALEQIAQDMATATAHYFNSSGMQQERSYRIMARCLPVLEAGQKEFGLRDAYGKHSVGRLDGENPVTGYKGRHSVIIGAGKLYQSQQEEQSDFADELLKIGVPEVLLAVLPGAIRMKGLGEYGEQLAEMVESLQPPQMQAVREQGKPMPPEAMQAIQQGKQAVQALNAHAEELERKVIELEDERKAKVLDIQSREREGDADRANKIAIAEINASTKEDINTLQQQVIAIRHVMDVLTAHRQMDQASMESGLDREHQAGMQDSAQAHATDQQSQQLDAQAE